ncbi:MAG: hypothetical protein KC443_02490 [Anaerolineales bacterium]|nr:hypothetical protein [Anaerolineales bacterium]
MNTLLFSPAAYNLAETTRAIEIAKACRHDFDILFASYGGKFEHLITEAGFPMRHLTPQVTPEKADHLYKVDQGQAIGYFFTKTEVEEQVQNELDLLRDVQPLAVITGFNFSNSISCRVAGVPLIWLTQSTWLFDILYKNGLATYPDMLDVPPLNWLPERWLTWLGVKSMAMTALIFRPFRQVAQAYGINQLKTFTEWLTGDFNLLPEPAEFCGLDLPPSFHYIPPLIGKLDTPIPPEVQNIPHDKPIVYFAMGSSGQPAVIARIIEGFAGKPYRVIAPVRAHLEKVNHVHIPDNVIVTDWLPAHKVNPMADISVIHGGIGTVMTACLAGKPVVGIAMMMEQEANIDCLVRKGFAMRIRKNRFTPERLCAAIDTLLADESARQKAKAFQAVMEQWDDPDLIRRFFTAQFLHHEPVEVVHY